MMWTQLCGCRRQNMHIRAPLIHPGIAAIVYSACGHACSIFVCGLCRYTMFNRLKCSIGHMTGSWKNASVFLQSPGKVLEFFVTREREPRGNNLATIVADLMPELLNY